MVHTLGFDAIPELDSDYEPHEGETFMGERQQTWFRTRLLAWKADILRESSLTIEGLREATLSCPDLSDRAAGECDHSLELRARDRQRKLISKIDAALRRLNEGAYGYCEVTGEPIGLRRLLVRPTATLSIEAQEAHERSEKVHRDI